MSLRPLNSGSIADQKELGVPAVRIVLVSMPWQWLQMPSVAIGILRPIIRRSAPHAEVNDYYGNIEWAEYLLACTGGTLTPEYYSAIADAGMFRGVGDWIFATAMADSVAVEPRLFEPFLDGIVETGIAYEMRELAKPFVNHAAETILSHSPELVGFTSTFSQNIPSLAVAHVIKNADPGIKIIFGGANCDGDMGAALHKNYPFVDYVVRGEAEAALPTLLQEIESHQPSISSSGVCWRDGRTIGHVNTQDSRPVPISAVPSPDYSEWWETFNDSPISEYMEPCLVLESSRGCWWGEKHHCKFCGLNGSLMQFRAKSAERVWEEIQQLVGNYKILDLVTTDNILDMRMLDELLPVIASADWDLRIHYEVKANLRPEHLKLLRDAGVVHIQPGIENLNTHVLQIMDKGVHATQNVALLREAENFGLTLSWNYLYGFPGEEPEHYTSIMRQLPALAHLQPPTEVVRLAVERFSPYYNQPGLGFRTRVAASHYAHIYNLPQSELDDIAYVFDAPPAGIGEDLAESLKTEVNRWRSSYANSSLIMWQAGEKIFVEDRRYGADKIQYLVHPYEVAAFRALLRPRSIGGLARHLKERGHSASRETLSSWLCELKQMGWVFEDADRYVALPTEAVPMHASARAPRDE
jgi:ribosomal peptide maturation radical SAM protein 1